MQKQKAAAFRAPPSRASPRSHRVGRALLTWRAAKSGERFSSPRGAGRHSRGASRLRTAAGARRGRAAARALGTARRRTLSDCGAVRRMRPHAPGTRRTTRHSSSHRERPARACRPGRRVYRDPVHAAPSSTGYRTRARFAVLANRGRAVVGYRRAASRHIEDIPQCLVLDERLDAALPLLQAMFADERGEGEVAVALGDKGRPVLDVRFPRGARGNFSARLAHHVESGGLAGAEVWLPGAREPARTRRPSARSRSAPMAKRSSSRPAALPRRTPR